MASVPWNTDVVVTLAIGEISQVRRLIHPGELQKTVRAQEIVFLADEDLRALRTFCCRRSGAASAHCRGCLAGDQKQRAWRAKRAEPGSQCDSRKTALVPAYGPRTLLAVHV